MSLGSNYPIYLNDVEIPWGKSWNETSSVVENTKQSEAGTTVYSVTRFDKLSVATSFKCMDDLAKTLKRFSKEETLTLKRYDVLEGGYDERQVVMRSFKCNLVMGSETLDGLNGIWTVSFNLNEI